MNIHQYHEQIHAHSILFAFDELWPMTVKSRVKNSEKIVSGVKYSSIRPFRILEAIINCVPIATG